MDKTGATFTSDATGNILADPFVDLLQYNGGITPTCAIQLGSPAIDALPQGLANVSLFDQRGYARLGNPDIDLMNLLVVFYQKLRVTGIHHQLDRILGFSI